MRLGAQLLTGYCGVNNFNHTNNIQRNEGDQTRIYLQLVDLNKKLCSDTKGSCYIRYMPATGSLLSISIDSIDDDNKIERLAVQTPEDPSIFFFDIYAGESLDSENLHLSLSEPSQPVKTGVVNGAIKTQMTGSNGGQSFC